MLRSILTYTILLISGSLAAQPENDHCENALDITPFAFNRLDYLDYFVSTGFSGATVDASNYGSSNCWGYAESTTPAYPDVWLKSTLQADAHLVQFYTFYGVDTFQISTYIGTCSNLFQNDCYTVAPDDTLLQYGVTLNYIPHDSAHALYFQIKAPVSSTNVIDIHIHYEIYYSFTYYFAYSTPASTSNTSSTNTAAGISPVIRLFPSPASDEITLESTDEIKNLEVTNLTGNRMLFDKVNYHKTILDISTLSPGMYYMRIETNNGWAIRNFAVVR
jgi:hypothetical protein